MASNFESKVILTMEKRRCKAEIAVTVRSSQIVAGAGDDVIDGGAGDATTEGAGTLVGAPTLALTGGELWHPLTAVHIFGLLFATVATLFFVPAVFTIIHGRNQRSV